MGAVGGRLMETKMEGLLHRKKAADLLGVRPQTLSAWIHRGVGPPYIKLGRCVRYRPADLEGWLQARTFVAEAGHRRRAKVSSARGGKRRRPSSRKGG